MALRVVWEEVGVSVKWEEKRKTVSM
ncbi:hypothetical protein [Paenibacillus xylanexedens]